MSGDGGTAGAGEPLAACGGPSRGRRRRGDGGTAFRRVRAALGAKRGSDAIARASLVMTGPDLFNERSPPKLFFGVCRFALDEVRGRLAMDFDKHDPLCCLPPRGCTLARVRARGRKNQIRYADRAAACAPGVLKIRV